MDQFVIQLDNSSSEMKYLMLFEILATLTKLRTLCQQDAIKLRIECENLETVYVEYIDEGRLLVHDHYHAISYLMTSNDKTYKDFKEIGLPYVRDLCAKHGVELLDLDLVNLGLGEEARGWVIGAYADNDARVRELILAIADCVDELFASVLRER